MAGDETTTLAGTTVARNGFAALIRGASGCGKSDLALRAISTPIQLPNEQRDVAARQAEAFQLVSDDQTQVARHGLELLTRAPDAINGLLEVRGIGIIRVAAAQDVPLVLVVDLVAGPVERMPDHPGEPDVILGTHVEQIELVPFEGSAPLKLALALERAAQRRLP